MKIIETSERCKKRIEEQKQKEKCPECGSTSCYGSYSIDGKFFSLKFRKKYEKRCTRCGCLFEYYGEWENE